MARLDLAKQSSCAAKPASQSKPWKARTQTIWRAGEILHGQDGSARPRLNLSSGPLTVLKLAKPDQDMRFDVPVVGVPTIETMVAGGRDLPVH